MPQIGGVETEIVEDNDNSVEILSASTTDSNDAYHTLVYYRPLDSDVRFTHAVHTCSLKNVDSYSAERADVKEKVEDELESAGFNVRP